MVFKLFVFLLWISSLGTFFGFDHKWTCNCSPTESLEADPRIIIVGGGVAGVAAATMLVQNGFENVKILEAENRLGGRVWTVPFGEKYVDLGAHWIHGKKENIVFEIAHKLNLTAHSDNYFADPVFLTDRGDQVPIGDEIIHEIGEIITDQDSMENSTDNLYDFVIPKVKEVLQNKIQDDQVIEAFSDMVSKMLCVDEGCDDLRDVSTEGISDHNVDLTSSGDYYTNWKDGGYNSIIEILLNKHPRSIGPPVDIKDVILNCEVTKIDWNNTEVLVQCADGSFHRADHVIVTVSLGVLKEQHSTLFNPPLPSDKISAINDLGIGTIDKIYLYFPHQWWPQVQNNTSAAFSLLWISPSEHTELTWEEGICAVYSESTTPNVLVMWLRGDGAHQLEAQSEENVKEGAFKVLTKFLGKKYEIPPPSSVIRSQWYTNNHFRGSYSYRKMGFKKSSVSDLAKPVTNSFDKEALMFAGEATHGSFFGTVHGALETGWREADCLIKKYKSS